MNTDQKNKTIIRSFRVTEKQDAIISKKAYDRGMSYGAYVALSATCGDEQFDPTKSVHMQNVINIQKTGANLKVFVVMTYSCTQVKVLMMN